MSTTLSRLSALLVVTFLIAPHAGETKDPPTALELQFAGIERIVVLPTVDARSGEKASVKIENIRKQVMNSLKKKNYLVEAAAAPAEAGDLVEEELREARPDWVRSLGPAESRWVMVVCLNDLASKMTFGSTGNAELSAYLYDKQEGALIWQAKGVGQSGQGGLAGMMMKGMMKGEALGMAARNLMRDVPKRPKVKK